MCNLFDDSAPSSWPNTSDQALSVTWLGRREEERRKDKENISWIPLGRGSGALVCKVRKNIIRKTKTHTQCCKCLTVRRSSSASRGSAVWWAEKCWPAMPACLRWPQFSRCLACYVRGVFSSRWRRKKNKTNPNRVPAGCRCVRKRLTDPAAFPCRLLMSFWFTVSSRPWKGWKKTDKCSPFFYKSDTNWRKTRKEFMM